MGRMKEIVIDLDTLTPDDWAFVRQAALSLGVPVDGVDLTDAATIPPALLGALVHVIERKANPHATYTNSIRLALDAQGVPRGE